MEFFVISRSANFHQGLPCMTFDIMMGEGGTPHPRYISYNEKFQEAFAFSKTFFHDNKNNSFQKTV